MPPPGSVRAMRQVCTDHDFLFVADEMITGFGRTGPLFAREDQGIPPDLMTVVKGLTSGNLLKGAVLLPDQVRKTIAEGAGAKGPGQGFAYSAYPVRAAVAPEVPALYEGGLPDNGRVMGARLMAERQGLADHPLVGEVRGRGVLAAVDLVTDKAAKTSLPAALNPAIRLFDRVWGQGRIVGSIAQGASVSPRPGAAPKATLTPVPPASGRCRI
jgi:adenosylmethionine-8-amino-7-oxononanoate aminotransferase